MTQDMTPQGYAAWRARMATRLGLKTYSHAAAARDLGISLPMSKLYEKGANNARRDCQGAPLAVTIPRAVALACAALEAGLAAE